MVADDPRRDGQHDFDFEIGSWTTELSRLVSPLSGSKEWVEYRGTTVVRPVWDGLANLVGARRQWIGRPNPGAEPSVV